MRIEIWADLVCPWCFIGKRRLQQALSELEMNDETELVHRAFQLDPQASTHSVPTMEHLAAKYGVSPEQALEMMSEVTDVAAKVGLDYHLDRTMTGNTRDVHRLVLWTQDHQPEQAQPLLEDLYSAYFERGERIFTLDDLRPFAEARGLDSSIVTDLFDGRDYLDSVARDQDDAREIGASGVPFFVFDRRIGLSGAQPMSAFAEAITQTREAR